MLQVQHSNVNSPAKCRIVKTGGLRKSTGKTCSTIRKSCSRFGDRRGRESRSSAKSHDSENRMGSRVSSAHPAHVENSRDRREKQNEVFAPRLDRGMSIRFPRTPEIMQWRHRRSQQRSGLHSTFLHALV